MTAIVGYKGQILVTSSPSVSGTNLSLIDSGDHKTYNVSTSDTKRYWDQTQLSLFVVQTSTDGTTWVTASLSAYTITRFVNGQVVFNSAVTGSALARMGTVYYFAFSALGNAHEWQLTIDSNLVDITAFSTTGWKSQLETLRFWNAKLSQFYADNTFLTLMGNLMVLVLYPDQTALNRYESYGYIKSDAIKDAVAGVIDEEITVEGTGNLYFMTN